MATNQSLNHFHIRTIEKRDEKRIWEIRNHPEIRKQAFRSEEIPFSFHRIWFNQRLALDRAKFFVLEKTGPEMLIVGYCRYKPIPQAYEISIAIDPTYHQQGLGSKLMNETPSRVPKRKIIARVKIANKKSKDFFEKNGFSLTRTFSDHYELIKQDT